MIAKSFSDIEAFLAQEEEKVRRKVAEIGRESETYAKEHGNYKDRTKRLRSSNHSNVDEDCSLELYNDAPYASNVESKGYDVMTGAYLYAAGRLEEEFDA